MQQITGNLSNSSVFNMGLATLERIDVLIRKQSSFSAMKYMNGNPLHGYLLNIQMELYKELYPFLEEKEHKEATKKFLDVFRKNPITKTTTGLFVPDVTEATMLEFDFWIRKMLKAKGLLMSTKEDPRFAMK